MGKNTGQTKQDIETTPKFFFFLFLFDFFFFQRQIITGLVGAKETATAEQIKERLTATLGLSGDKAKAERIFAGVQRFACFCVVCEKQ